MGETDVPQGRGDFSLSFSKSKSTTREANNNEGTISQQMGNLTQPTGNTDTSDNTTATPMTHNVILPLVETVSSEGSPSAVEASEVAQEISYEEERFATNLRELAQRISKLGTEAVFASTATRVLESYVHVMLKCLDQFETLRKEEAEYYKKVKDTVHVRFRDGSAFPSSRKSKYTSQWKV
jgi:hypothetical protein